MKKVMIVGFGPGWKNYPQDYDGEIWSLNCAALIVPRLDRLFIADKISAKTDIKNGFYLGCFGDEKDKKIPVDEAEYKRRVIERDIPFISCHPYPEIPKYEAFPLKEVVETFGQAYFSNCIAYMIAYAILKDYQHIELLGVRQGLLTEYSFHKGSIEFWIGMALGHGIRVTIKGDSHVLRTHNGILYGYNRTLEELKENNYKLT